ncbi:MAG: hypothetical protein HYZ71_11475 [Deltaproteobacteria bacterium]|nr:hypothetical protein [Deltaproteobacteria bacterium]
MRYLFLSFLLIGALVTVKPTDTAFGRKLSAFTHAISLIPEARASGGYEQLANAVRMLFFLIAGFPDDATYTALTGGGDGPPKNGMVGFINDITSMVGQAVSVTTCAELPSSGDYDLSGEEGTFTLSFSTPDRTIPTGYTGAGSAYEKKMAVALNGSTVMSVQFNCTNQSGYGVLNFPETGGAYRKINIVYENITGPKADFSMHYNTENERFQMHLESSLSDNTYWYYMNRAATADSGSGVSGARVYVKGSATGNKATTLFQSINAASMSALAADSNASSTSLTGGSSSETGFLICVDLTSPADSALGACSGLSLGAPSATFFDSSGVYSISYAAGTSYTSSLQNMSW